tara:strand:- start:5134 stop:5442 length:309 start_codon:yes stop_codon:yes gene_type:complete
MSGFVKIFIYKVINSIAFFALGTFIISMFMKLRGKVVDNNLLLSFMLMFTLLSCAIAMGEVRRLKKDNIFEPETFKFSYKRTLIIFFCFVPLALLVVYNFVQ